MPRGKRQTQEQKDLVAAARGIVASMKQISDGIRALAGDAGAFEALLANNAQHPTLSTPSSERTFELVGRIDNAYNELADHLSDRAKAILPP